MSAASKNPQTENFPVASLLLSSKVRAQVLQFYHYARKADDIADHPTLSIEEKLSKLNELEQAFENEHFHKLLKAFRQDCMQNRYSNFEDLLIYCRYSANPVGRFLLDVHGEKSPDALNASDGLCTVLQILNHLQDCGKDYKELDRIYLPLNMIQNGETYETLLGQTSCPPALRSVINQCLKKCDHLMEQARPLERHLLDWRLKFQTRCTIQAANRLSYRLKHADPLASRVELTKMDKLFIFLKGVL